MVYKVSSFSLDQMMIFGSNDEVAMISSSASSVVLISSSPNSIGSRIGSLLILLSGTEEDVGS